MTPWLDPFLLGAAIGLWLGLVVIPAIGLRRQRGAHLGPSQTVDQNQNTVNPTPMERIGNESGGHARNAHEMRPRRQRVPELDDPDRRPR